MWRKIVVVGWIAAQTLSLSASQLNQHNPFSEQLTSQQTESVLDIEALKSQWQMTHQQQQLKLEQQRATFLQIDALLSAANKQKKLSTYTEKVIQRLISQLTGYPLKIDAEYALLASQLTFATTPEQQAKADTALQQFLVQYPHSQYAQSLSQRRFELLFNQQKLSELIDYATQIQPQSPENQCRILAAEYQLFAEKQQINPELAQAEQSSVAINSQLLTAFTTFWRHHQTIPSECGALEAYWRDHGGKTREDIQQKAVQLFKTSRARTALSDLAQTVSDTGLQQWLETLQTLQQQPERLRAFAENEELTSINKTIVISAFPRFINTLPETVEKPNFEEYQHWATRWQLTTEERQQWKITFLTRFFDNSDPLFQQWRDQQILLLKTDKLTERRIRMAIWQKSPLMPWLVLLSDEAQKKAEWRYWLAKSDPSQREQLLQGLVNERGFYAMLAAKALNQGYVPPIKFAQSLTEEQIQSVKAELDRIAELRTLPRMNQAKVAWIYLLKHHTQPLGLVKIAYERQWFDLAVEGSIQTKAWDYLTLRLPNAYSQWFDVAVEDSPISKSFAMAVARQESAWNPQAQSHANARGLMQLLPTTAALTASNSQLPYLGEKTLFLPLANILLGTQHLAELATKYPDNRILIATAYNAGASRVEKWLARANGTLAMDEFIASIPFLETRGYVQNVLAYDYYYQFLNKMPILTLFNQVEFERQY